MFITAALKEAALEAISDVNKKKKHFGTFFFFSLFKID